MLAHSCINKLPDVAGSSVDVRQIVIANVLELQNEEACVFSLLVAVEQSAPERDLAPLERALVLHRQIHLHILRVREVLRAEIHHLVIHLRAELDLQRPRKAGAVVLPLMHVGVLASKSDLVMHSGRRRVDVVSPVQWIVQSLLHHFVAGRSGGGCSMYR